MMRLEKPKKRSKLRQKLGHLYYTLKRRSKWCRMRKHFATTYQRDALPYIAFQHKTLLLRQLKDVDMWMQHHKITNLKQAVPRLHTILIKPGEVFSYWYLIGKPTRHKGYVDGMILDHGHFKSGVGGGLCQLSNLIFWMTLHTPLTIVERHRHSYDVFPDANRTQPFGSGATCFYPHVDLMIQNNTEDTYQLILKVGEEYLEGAWRVTTRPTTTYRIVEREHRMEMTYFGGYSRHNKLYQQKYSEEGVLLGEEVVVENSAMMMYAPFVEQTTTL